MGKPKQKIGPRARGRRPKCSLSKQANLKLARIIQQQTHTEKKERKDKKLEEALIAESYSMLITPSVSRRKNDLFSKSSSSTSTVYTGSTNSVSCSKEITASSLYFAKINISNVTTLQSSVNFTHSGTEAADNMSVMAPNTVESTYNYPQVEDMCLFCVAKCAPKYVIEEGGKLTRLKREGASNGIFRRSDEGNRNVSKDELVAIEEDLKTVFILGKLLNVPKDNWNKYLGRHDGQYRPGLWFPLCEDCDTVVHQCYHAYREMLVLEKAMENGKTKLKRNVFNSRRTKMKERDHELEEQSVWEAVRSQIIKGDSDLYNLSDSDSANEDDEAEEFCIPEDEIPSITLSTPVEQAVVDPLALDELDVDTNNLASKSSDNTKSVQSTKPKHLPNPTIRRKGGKFWQHLHKRSPTMPLQNYLIVIPKKGQKQKSTDRSRPENVYEKVVHRCNLCGAFGTDRQEFLRAHGKLHRAKTGEICPDCGWLYPPGDRQYHKIRCPHEPASSTWKRLYSKNLIKYVEANQKFVGKFVCRPDAPFYCDHCPYMTFHQSRLIIHFNTFHSPQDLVKCDFSETCKKMLISKQFLQLHRRYEHNQEIPPIESPLADGDPIGCKHCSKAFPSKRQLDIHIIQNHQKEMWHCAQCGVKNQTVQNYMAHMRKHTGEKPFECEYCRKRFTSIDFVQRHQLQHHRDKLGLEESRFICDKCGLSYASAYSLRKHKEIVCRSEGESFAAARDHVCKLCGQTFKLKERLMKHLKGLLHKWDVEGSPQHFKWVDGVYVCNYCGEIMNKGISVPTHMRKVHGDKINLEFKCDACSSVFPGPRALGNHRMTCEAIGKGGDEVETENGDVTIKTIKIHRCPFCPMEFRSKNISLLHKRTVHADVFTQFMCDTCGVSFTKEHYLEKHKLVCQKEAVKS